VAEIIGISAGRKNKVTESSVKAILEGTGKESTFISLSGKVIRPCEACNGCVKTNRCILKDDFQPVLEQCYQAEAIVFGAPNYWNHMNAKGQSFWERTCFSGRHNSVFPLQGKLGVIVAVSGGDEGHYVVKDLETFFEDARIHLVESITVQGEYACFTCGHGNYCPVGGFKELFPLGTPITKSLFPSLTNQHPEISDLKPEKRDLLEKARGIGKTLSKVLKTKRAKEEGFVKRKVKK
jgi:hypothetical protein